MVARTAARIYTATTGFRPINTSTSAPRTGPCDAVIAWPATETRHAGHLWINYTGCDSLYSVAVDATTVFAGGHQRWASNPLGCDRQGPGAVVQPGLGEFDPLTGAHQPGPSRGRGHRRQDLLRTRPGSGSPRTTRPTRRPAPASSNRRGICFLPNG